MRSHGVLSGERPIEASSSTKVLTSLMHDILQSTHFTSSTLLYLPARLGAGRQSLGLWAVGSYTLVVSGPGNFAQPHI